MDKKSLSRIGILIAVLLLVGAGVFVWMLTTGNTTNYLAPTAEFAEHGNVLPGGEGADAPSPVANSATIEPPYESPAEEVGEPETGAATVYPEADEEFDNTVADIELIVRDDTGTPLQAVAIEFDVAPAVSMTRSRTGGNRTLTPDKMKSNLPFRVVLDSEGRATLRIRTPAHLCLRIDDDRWCFATGTGTTMALPSIFAVWPGEAVLTVSQVETRSKHELLAVASLRHEFLVEFEDGLPYEGNVRIELGYNEVRYASPWIVSTGGAKVELPGIPRRAILSVSAFPDRMGFEQAPVWRVLVAELGPFHTFQIQATSAPQGRITLRFAESARAESLTVLVTGAELPGAHFEEATNGRVEVTTGLLRPATYNVRVGGQKVWEAREVVVRPGEVSTLDVVLQEPAIIKGRVVSADGKPLEKIVATTTDGFWPMWEAVPKVGDETRKSNFDKDGYFTIKGVVPGERDLWVMSPGCERKRIRMTFRSGVETDVGTVYLERSTSTVTLTVVGMDAALKYVACMIEPGGHPLARPVEVGTLPITFSDVASGKYRACVFLAGSGETKSIPFEVTQNGSAQTIELDVADLKPRK